MAKIRRGFIEDYFHGINREILLFDKNIKYNDKSRHFFNAIDSNKNITFYGNKFIDGDIFYITNISENPDATIYQTNTDVYIYIGQMYMFYYTSEISIQDHQTVKGPLMWYVMQLI